MRSADGSEGRPVVREANDAATFFGFLVFFKFATFL